MASLNLVAATHSCAFTKFPLPPTNLSLQSPGRGRVSRTVQCMSTATSSKPGEQTVVRRSANYKPPLWDHDYIQSLTSNYAGEPYEKWAAMLRDDVKVMLENLTDPADRLEMIDDLQRLGVSYHFEDQIQCVLESIYSDTSVQWNKEDLCGSALKFRLLRQHGYKIPQEIFNNFVDEAGNFKACHCEDTKGLLYLYEASYLLFEGESILEKARDFTTINLKQNLKKKDIDEDLAKLVIHALELPLHWRMPRLEAKWFINVYERRPDMNRRLLQLAKLDFNMVQATHLEDLKDMSRWWKNIGLGEKLSFARDRIMENFLWTVGVNFKPQFGYFRRVSTIVNALITTIDDVYDVYGTLDELELFTNAVERWDINATEQLPAYMKICFLALFNSVSEIAYGTLTEEGIYIIPYLQKAWADLCKTYLVEARWFHSGYIPTLEEYMNNAWISISAPVILIHAYFLSSNIITMEGLKCLEKYPNIIRWSATILRLADDLGTSSDELKRGDVPKSIQCYMHETGASEEDAREHIKHLIGDTWKKMNAERVANSPFSQTFIEIAQNLGRMAQCMYQYGDGHGAQRSETTDRVSLLLINPIPLK